MKKCLLFFFQRSDWDVWFGFLFLLACEVWSCSVYIAFSQFFPLFLRPLSLFLSLSFSTKKSHAEVGRQDTQVNEVDTRYA